jgi:hypothetical protein
MRSHMGMIFWKNCWKNIQIKNSKLFEYLTDENDCMNGMKVGNKQMKNDGYSDGVKRKTERKYEKL